MHPAQFLLFTSGLSLFWLMPLIAWTLLKGQRDTAARCWFLGTASYAIVAVLFVTQGPVSHWLHTAGSAAFATLMVVLLIESMRIELRPGPVRWALIALIFAFDAVLIGVTHAQYGLVVARVYRYLAHGEPGGLGDFTVTTNLAFLANYFSVVF
jgi:hypothetical protein